MESKRLITVRPMITFYSTGNLSTYLVRAKLYSLKRVTGSYKCNGKRCVVCVNVNETPTFTSTVIHETCKINHFYNCIDNA